MRITSWQNKRIKNVVKLRQRRQRDAQRLTVVEGVREVLLALQRQVVPQEAFICPELVAGTEAETAVSLLQQSSQSHATRLYELSPDLFARIAYRDTSGGLLLTVPYWGHSLADSDDANPIGS